MPIAEKHCPTVVHFVRKLPGGSQPVLIQADDGLLYAVKFANNLQGPNLLFNESMGTELYRSCGLPVPAWKPLQITSNFLDRHPYAWIETENGLKKPSAGLCFGSQYIGAAGTRALEILPAALFGRIGNRMDFWLAWLVDVCASHTDNRQAIFVEESDGNLQLYFIDHGHLFGGAAGGGKAHFIAPRYLDSRIYPGVSSRRLRALVKKLVSVDRKAIRKRLSVIPSEWKTPSALDGLDECLQCLADNAFLENLSHAMAQSLIRSGEDGGFTKRSAYIPRTVLRAGIPPTSAISNFAKQRAHHFACGQG